MRSTLKQSNKTVLSGAADDNESIGFRQATAKMNNEQDKWSRKAEARMFGLDAMMPLEPRSSLVATRRLGDERNPTAQHSNVQTFLVLISLREIL